MHERSTQCAQKISVYGLPGRCKHLDCLIFQHLESRLAVSDQLARDFLDLNQLFVSNSSLKYQWTYFAANNCRSKHLPSTSMVGGMGCLGWLNGDSAAHTWRRRPVLTAMAVTPIRDSLAAKQQRWPQQEEEEGGEAMRQVGLDGSGKPADQKLGHQPLPPRLPPPAASVATHNYYARGRPHRES